MASMAILHARNGPTPREMARKFVGSTVRRPKFKGDSLHGHEATCGIPLRLGAAGCGHARYLGHDARESQSK